MDWQLTLPDHNCCGPTPTLRSAGSHLTPHLLTPPNLHFTPPFLHSPTSLLYFIPSLLYSALLNSTFTLFLHSFNLLLHSTFPPLFLLFTSSFNSSTSLLHSSTSHLYSLIPILPHSFTSPVLHSKEHKHAWVLVPLFYFVCTSL